MSFFLICAVTFCLVVYAWWIVCPPIKVKGLGFVEFLLGVIFAFQAVGFAYAALGSADFVTIKPIKAVGSGTPETSYWLNDINGASTAQPLVTAVSSGGTKYQFVSYFNTDEKLMFGRRKMLAGGVWSDWYLRETAFENYDINDAHNTICIGIDDAGYLHSSWGMHADSMLYTRSNTSVLNDNNFSLSGDTVGNSAATTLGNTITTNNEITYPRFYNIPSSNELLFTFRTGASGDGEWQLTRWDSSSSNWADIHNSLDHPWIDSHNPTYPTDPSTYCAYPNGFVFDSEGDAHITWCWRSSYISYQKNYNVMYARSPDDGVNWYRQDNAHYNLNGYHAIDQDHATPIVALPEDRSQVTHGSMAVGPDDTIYMAKWWAPEAASGNHLRQFMLTWKDESGIHTSQIGTRESEYGNQQVPDALCTEYKMGVPQVAVDDDNRVFVAFFDYQRKTRLTVAVSQDSARDDWQFFDLDTQIVRSNPLIDLKRWQDDGVLSVLYETRNNNSPSVLEWDAKAYFDTIEDEKPDVEIVDNGIVQGYPSLHSYTIKATGAGITTLSKFEIDGNVFQVDDSSEWLGDGSATGDPRDSYVIFGDMRIPDVGGDNWDYDKYPGGPPEKFTEETCSAPLTFGTLNNYDDSIDSWDDYMILGEPSDEDEEVDLIHIVVADGESFSINFTLLSSLNYNSSTGEAISAIYDYTLTPLVVNAVPEPSALILLCGLSLLLIRPKRLSWMRSSSYSLKSIIVLATMSFIAVPTAATAGIVLNGGGLAIVEEGGPTDYGNLGNPLYGTGVVAFATPCYPGSSSYSIPHLKDQILGHRNSWFAKSPDATLHKGFVGLSFGTTLRSLGGFAFGRDSAQEFFDQRCIGEYKLQYTTVDNPDETTPNASWTDIGTLDYQWYSPSPNFTEPCTCLSTRHRFRFDTIQATGIRLIVPNTYDQNSVRGTIVEEFEVYGTAYSPRGPALSGSNLALVEEGGTAPSGNVAGCHMGSVAFANGEFVEGTSSFEISEANDGDYGENSSWISYSTTTYHDPSFIGINFKEEMQINSFAFGRDNDTTDGSSPRDRYIGEYRLQYTTVDNPDETTSDANWTDIGTLDYCYSPQGGVTNFQDPVLRHRYTFDEVTATGIRLWVPATAGKESNGDENSMSRKAATAIDELEVYCSGGDVLVPGDANGDGQVDSTDASTLSSHWLEDEASWAMGDFNSDGVVDSQDCMMLANNWLYGVGARGAVPVPEPSSFALLLAGILSLMISIRRGV